MKRGRLFFSLLFGACALVCGSFLCAQEPKADPAKDEAVQKAREEQRKVQQTLFNVFPHLAKPVAKLMAEHGGTMKTQIFSQQEKEGFDEYVGISEEQAARQEANRKEFETDFRQVFMPVFLKAMTAKTDEDFKAIAGEIDQKATEALLSFKKKQDALFTAEQKTKIAELNLQSNQGGFDIGPISLDAYELLDLTESQREEFQKIKKEYMDGFENLVQKMVDIQMKIFTPGENEATTAETIKEGHEKYQGELEALAKEGEQLFSRTKARILALLDKEQQERFVTILAKTPGFLKKRINPQAEEDDEEWKKSWKPGDPVPQKKSTPRKSFPLMDIVP